MTATRRWAYTRARRAVQASVAAVYLLLPFAAGKTAATAGTLASLKLGPLDLNEPAAAFSAVLASRFAHVPLSLAIGTLPLLVLALFLGPVFCSWACPWGLLSEGLDAVRQRVRPRAWPADSWRPRHSAGALRPPHPPEHEASARPPSPPLRRPRALALLGLAALSAALEAPLAAILSAPRLVTSLPLELVFLRAVAPATGLLLLALLALELAGPRRVWCRALCPAGALLNVLRAPRQVRPVFDESLCLCPRVAACHQRCAWGIDPRRMDRFDGCSNCLACVEGCPSGALATARRRPAESSSGLAVPGTSSG